MIFAVFSRVNIKISDANDYNGRLPGLIDPGSKLYWTYHAVVGWLEEDIGCRWYGHAWNT